MHKPALWAKQAQTIRVEIVGDNGCHCAAIGLYVSADNPIQELCRRLLQLGYHPDTRLDCFRGPILLLTVHGVGVAAGQDVDSEGADFASVSAVRMASLVRHSHQARTSGTRSKRRRRSTPYGDRAGKRRHDLITAVNPGH
jgi:hypothetical protein